MSGSGALTYQWKRRYAKNDPGAPINAATTAAYTPSNDDVGAYLSVTVSRTGLGQSATAEAVGPVLPPHIGLTVSLENPAVSKGGLRQNRGNPDPKRTLQCGPLPIRQRLRLLARFRSLCGGNGHKRRIHRRSTIGRPSTLTAKVLPSNATNKFIEWTVKSGAAAISGGNKLTANREGERDAYRDDCQEKEQE